MDQLADMVVSASSGVISRQKENILGTSMAIASMFTKGKSLEDLFKSMDSAIDEAKSRLKGGEHQERDSVETKERQRQSDMKKTMQNLGKLRLFLGK